MLKMYHDHPRPGGSAAFWEHNWAGSRFEDALRFCEVDPLRRLFERYACAGSVMLEGGCGQGHYVAYYRARGVRTVGLDFAQETLAVLQARAHGLILCGGDVSRLPFRDRSFDVYYSGGVVEHFEAGAEAALAEARRVLKPGGVLLISVPYFSPLRRALTPVKRGVWRHVSRPERDASRPPGARQFFQYAYTRAEFERMLVTAGFRVLGTQGYSIVWGLYDVPLVRRALGTLLRGVPRRAASTPPAAAHTGGGTAARPSLLKRLVVGEDATLPVAGPVVRALSAACANMMMYVCEPDGSR
jgi:SAM-dependent methyltransferase